MRRGYFITGTDTGVGKTHVASALVRHFCSRGLHSAGMKPVAAGCSLVNNELVSEDVAHLMAASNVDVPQSMMNPYAFEPPVAPHIAAAQAGIQIDFGRIQEAFRQLGSMVDVVVIEGVGGFRVPLNDRQDTADLALALGLPVILVVGLRLGCINHALLAEEAIRARGLELTGWVANQVDPAMALMDENIGAIAQRISAPCVARVGWGEQPVFSLGES